MSTAATKPLFHEKSFLGVGLSAVALLITLWVCRLTSAPPEISQTLSGVALGLPTATFYTLQARSRNKANDAAALARGQLDRPVGLVIMLAAGGLLLVDTAIGLGFALLSSWLVVLVGLVGIAAVGVGAAFASFALGSHPYRGIAIAVAVALVARLIILSSLMSLALAAIDATADVAPVLYAGVILTFVLYFGIAAIGVRLGAKQRQGYIALKLARLAASHPGEVATAVANTPSGTSAATDAISASMFAGEGSPGPEAPANSDRAARLIAAAPAAPAGWYPDSELRGVERWWDGAAWSDSRRNIPESA